MFSKATYALVLGLVFCWSSGCAPVGGNGDTANDNDNAADNENDNGSEPAPTLFAVSSLCTPCHNALFDEAENDVSIGTAWQPTIPTSWPR